MSAILKMLKTAQANVEPVSIRMGEQTYLPGQSVDIIPDHGRCHFVSINATVVGEKIKDDEIIFDSILQLQMRLASAGLDVIKTENRYEFDGVRGCSLGQ